VNELALRSLSTTPPTSVASLFSNRMSELASEIFAFASSIHGNSAQRESGLYFFNAYTNCCMGFTLLSYFLIFKFAGANASIDVSMADTSKFSSYYSQFYTTNPCDSFLFYLFIYYDNMVVPIRIACCNLFPSCKSNHLLR
jgi:hypothetical protein